MGMNEPAGTGVVSGNLNNQVLLFRDQGYDFDTTFVDGSEPCTPADPSLYPTFVILDPNGAIATSGVGTDRGSGQWRAHWLVPADATTGEWRVVWTMYSTRQRTYQQELRFTVREANEPLELQQDVPAFVALEGTPGERVSLLVDLEHPIDLQLSLHETRSQGAYSRELLHFDAARMEHERVGVKTLWWTELPALAAGEWMLFWTFKRSPTGPSERVVKELFVPPPIFWELYPSLDSFLDRIQKDQHQPFGYYEDDMYRYLKRGMQLLNQANPVTTWQLYTMPRNWGLEDWLIRAAGYWAFADRAITAGEMQFCVTGDALIPTPTGLRPIRSLVGSPTEEQQVPRKFTVLTPDGAQTTLFVYKSEVIPVTRMVTKSGYEVSGRRTHPVLTLTPTMKLKWTHLTDVQPGDVVAVDRQRRDAKQVSLRRIAERVREARHAKQADHQGGVGSEREYNLPTILTKPLARLLGYLTAEGTVNAESGRITFSNTDRQLLRDFQRCWEHCFGFAPKITPTNSHLRDDTFSVQPGYVIDVCSVQVRDYLEALGLGRCTSHTKRLPWCIRRAPLAVARHFLQAYFEGDGCVKPDDYSGGLYSASLELLQNVQQLLLRFGYVTQLHPQIDKVHELVIRGPSWDQYAEQIGFFSRKNRERYRAPQTRTPQIESIPGLRRAIEAATVEVTQNHGWFNGERLKVSWTQLVEKNQVEHATYEHLREYLVAGGDDLKKCVPELYRRLELLEQYGFHWEVVEQVERDYKQARTYDIGLPDTDSPLAHAFATNGIVSHNSLGAQDITLDVERQQFYQAQAQDMFNNIMQYAGKSKREVLRHLRSPARNGLRLGTGVSATLGGADLLGGVTSPWLRGFSRARRRGGGY